MTHKRIATTTAKYFSLMPQKQKSAKIFFRSAQILPVNGQYCCPQIQPDIKIISPLAGE